MKKFLFSIALSIALPFHMPVEAKKLNRVKAEQIASKWPLDAKQTVVLVAIIGILFYVSPIKLLLQLIALCGFLFVIRNRNVIANAAKNHDVATLQQLVPQAKKDGTATLNILKNGGQHIYNYVMNVNSEEQATEKIT
jgi:hypothetical protein